MSGRFRTTGRRGAWLAMAAATALATAGGAGALQSAAGGQQERETVLRKPAPELVGDGWLNTPGKKPLTLASRRGKVTIVHFWTFG